MTDKRNTLDISTLNVKNKASTNSPKRYKNRYTFNLHVKETREELRNMVIPRGITLKMFPDEVNEGTLISIVGNNVNPNALCQREKNEMNEFINAKLKVLRDSPNELAQNKEMQKVETKIVSEEIASNAFNIYEQEGNTYGEI